MADFYTSNFASISTLKKAGFEDHLVAISASVPHWYRGPRCRELALPLETVKAAKAGEMSWAEYVDRFSSEVLLNHTPEEVAGMIGEGAVMLCWCARDANCHRQLVAGYLRATGYEVKEWTPEAGGAGQMALGLGAE